MAFDLIKSKVRWFLFRHGWALLSKEHDQRPDLNELRSRIAEVITWCSRKPRPWNPRSTFRTIELAWYDFSSDRHYVVKSLSSKRLGMLQDCAWYKSTTQAPAPDLAGGRILVYIPDWNCVPGDEFEISDGFVNEQCVPPWDLWLDFNYDDHHENGTCGYLLCWVPPEMIALVDNTINNAAEVCLQWLDETDWKISRQLEKAGCGYIKVVNG